MTERLFDGCAALTAIALLVVGLQASRPLLVGGIALLAASALAGFVPAWFHGPLALGLVAGLVVPPLVLWNRQRG